MDQKKKQQIDKLWKDDAIVEEWVNCKLKNDEERMQEIQKELFNKGYFFGICQYAELEIGNRLLEIITGYGEWCEYLDFVGEADPKLAEALYVTFDSFGSHMLYNRLPIKQDDHNNNHTT